ncbi:MAG: acyl-CoA dehydrogenase [Candidatus Azotimanducaceae bacterium]
MQSFFFSCLAYNEKFNNIAANMPSKRGHLMPEYLSDDIKATQEKLETFIQSIIEPMTQQLDDAEATTQAALDIRAESIERGFFGKTQPSEYGGYPASNLELTVLRETLAAANSPLTSYVFGPGPGILHSATGHLKQHYLDPVLRGEKKGAFGFTEPDSAKRPTWARLNEAGDELTINGQKSYVTGGSTCNFVSVLVNVEGADGTKVGTAMAVIDREAQGVVIDREFSSMEGGGHVSMMFRDVRIPIGQVIGNIGEGMPRALGNIGNVRMMVAAESVGICLWVINYIEQHLLAPHRTGTPLGEREGVRLRLADMRIETYVARSALYRTARLVDSPENSVNEIIATKVFCTEVVGRVVDMAVQLAGGQALVVGHPLEKLYRRVRSMRLIEGASDLLRINLVKGKLELGKGRL